MKNCSYPECENLGEVHLELHDDVLSFCMYHSIIVGSSPDLFKVTTDSLGKKILSGPFYEVRLTEGIMAARELTKQPQPETIEQLKKFLESKR